MEYGAFEELRPSCSLRLFFHLVCQILESVQKHGQNVLHGELHEGVLERLGQGMAFCASFGSCHENSIRYMGEQLFLHAIKVLDYRSLVEVILDFLFGGHARLE